MRNIYLIPALLLAGACAPASVATMRVDGAPLSAARGAPAAPAAAALTLGTVTSASAPAGVSQYDQWDRRGDGYVRARLWVDGDRDWFRRGDRLRVRFSTSEDAYVAILHIDTDGYVDFLFPRSPWDDDYVRGGRSHTLSRGYQAGLSLRGRPGIGYIYMIASPVPFDYRGFADGRGGPWDWSLAGRSVVGDPFWAMEQITRHLVPDWRVPFATDYYSYHVDGRHRYPYYACASDYGRVRGGWGWSSGYSSCDRIDIFLRQHPYYYDARRYRGDRRAYIQRTYGRPVVEHRFKEPPTAAPAGPARDQAGQVRYREPESARPQVQSGSGVSGAQPARGADPQQAAPTQRQRPTLERREPQREPTPQREATPQRAEPQPERREPERARPTPQRQPEARQPDRKSVV